MKRISHELFPTKGVPHQNSSWLDKFEKILSSLNIYTVSGTLFKIIYLFPLSIMKIEISKLYQLWFSWLINCYLQWIIVNLVIFNISIFAKGLPFCSKLARKGKTVWKNWILVWKNWILFCKILMFVFIILFRNDFTTFWKMCRGVPFICLSGIRSIFYFQFDTQVL